MKLNFAQKMFTCPICSDVLLPHIRAGQAYFLCRSCRLEVHETSSSKNVQLQEFLEAKRRDNYQRSLNRSERVVSTLP
jgi:hypothetical protein